MGLDGRAVGGLPSPPRGGARATSHSLLASDGIKRAQGAEGAVRGWIGSRESSQPLPDEELRPGRCLRRPSRSTAPNLHTNNRDGRASRCCRDQATPGAFGLDAAATSRMQAGGSGSSGPCVTRSVQGGSIHSPTVSCGIRAGRSHREERTGGSENPPVLLRGSFAGRRWRRAMAARRSLSCLDRFVAFVRPAPRGGAGRGLRIASTPSGG